MAHVLRDVVESDLDAFYEHQRQPEATEMALFPAASAVVGLGWSIVLAVSALATRGRGLRRRWWWLAPTLFVALSIVVLVVAGKVSTEDAHPYDCLPLH